MPRDLTLQLVQGNSVGYHRIRYDGTVIRLSAATRRAIPIAAAQAAEQDTREQKTARGHHVFSAAERGR
jgi:hypothetical protein